MLSPKVNTMLVELKSKIEKEIDRSGDMWSDSDWARKHMTKWYNTVEDILAEKD